jgi:hypothetical protein
LECGQSSWRFLPAEVHGKQIPPHLTPKPKKR